jgi:hypothetical protein
MRSRSGGTTQSVSVTPAHSATKANLHPCIKRSGGFLGWRDVLWDSLRGGMAMLILGPVIAPGMMPGPGLPGVCGPAG